MTDDVARYLNGVREALGDLPAGTRTHIMEDLPDHLAEVASEGEGTLESKLGPPAGYAAELRATLDAPTGRDRRLTAALGRLRARLRPLDRRLGAFPGYGTASAFLVTLRPAWWVLRGYLAAMVVANGLNGGPSLGLLPRIGGSVVMAVFLLVAFIGGSIWLGQREGRLRPVARPLLWLVATGLAITAVVGFVTADSRWRAGFITYGDTTSIVYHDPYEGVVAVYVYDRDGRLVEGAQIVDQDGRPIHLGQLSYCPGATTDPLVRYPNCSPLPPYGTASPPPAPTGTPAPTPSPSPSGG